MAKNLPRHLHDGGDVALLARVMGGHHGWRTDGKSTTNWKWNLATYLFAESESTAAYSKNGVTFQSRGALTGCNGNEGKKSWAAEIVERHHDTQFLLLGGKVYDRTI